VKKTSPSSEISAQQYTLWAEGKFYFLFYFNVKPGGNHSDHLALKRLCNS